MLKFILKYCLLLFFPVLTYAQHRSAIQWGGVIAKPSSNAEYFYVGNWPEGIVYYIYSPSTVFSAAKAYIERYDNMTMLPQFTKPIVLNTSRGSKQLEIESFEKLGDYPVLFASYFNKDKNKIEVYARRYTLEGEPDGKDYKIAEFEAKKRSNVRQLNIIPSNMNEKVLVYYNQVFDKYQNEKTEFRIFDRDLNLLYDKFIEFPYKEKNFSVYRAMVDANGRVYLLVKILIDKSEITDRNIPRYRFGLVTFGPDRNEVDDYNLQIDNYYTSDISFSELNGKVICAGFYSSFSSDRAAGSFSITIDIEAKDVIKRTTDQFEKNFVMDIIPSRRFRRMTELPDFKVDQVVIFNDGSSVVVGEQFFIEEICFRDFRTGMINCQYNYNFNNIIAIKYDARGDVIWTANIPKYQQSSNDGGRFLSYSFCTKNDELIFLFNDHPRNINPTDDRVGVMTNVRKSVPVMVKLTSDGAFSRMALSNERVQKYFFVPRLSNQISNSSALLISVRNSRYRMGVVDFDF